jgi:Flp pilus assembly pilin Flp
MKLWERIRQNLVNEDGITTVEVILIMVVLIAVVLIFKEQILNLVENIMDKITKQAMKV